MNSNGTLKIDNARFILTVDAGRRIIRDGSILVRDGRIAEVGKAADMEDVQADRVIDASEMVVTPGMLNGHAHISYAHATRGIFPDTLGPGLPAECVQVARRAGRRGGILRFAACHCGDAEGRHDLLYGPGQHEVSRRLHGRLRAVGLPHHRGYAVLPTSLIR